MQEYLSVLVQIAEADGVHPVEREMLEERAATLGVSLDDLPPPPEEFSALPWSTRVLLYRDALTLAFVDGVYSDEEQASMNLLGERLGLPRETTIQIHRWVEDQSELVDRLAKLLEGPWT